MNKNLKLSLIHFAIVLIVILFWLSSCTYTLQPLKATDTFQSYNEVQQYMWIKHVWQKNPQKFIDAPECLGIATRGYFELKKEGKQPIMIFQEIPYGFKDHISYGIQEGGIIVNCENCLSERITFVFDEEEIWWWR